jgi:hypothetical protein
MTSLRRRDNRIYRFEQESGFNLIKSINPTKKYLGEAQDHNIPPQLHGIENISRSRLGDAVELSSVTSVATVTLLKILLEF